MVASSLVAAAAGCCGSAAATAAGGRKSPSRGAKGAFSSLAAATSREGLVDSFGALGDEVRCCCCAGVALHESATDVEADSATPAWAFAGPPLSAGEDVERLIGALPKADGGRSKRLRELRAPSAPSRVGLAPGVSSVLRVPSLWWQTGADTEPSRAGSSSAIELAIFRNLPECAPLVGLPHLSLLFDLLSGLLLCRLDLGLLPFCMCACTRKFMSRVVASPSAPPTVVTTVGAPAMAVTLAEPTLTGMLTVTLPAKLGIGGDMHSSFRGA